MPDFYTINRCILLVRPSQNMIDWINSLSTEAPVSYEATMIDDNTDVYLLPEFDEPEEARNWLKENYLDFLESSLEEWCPDADRWPDDMSWAGFEVLLDYTIQTNVVDTVPEEEDEEDHHDEIDLNAGSAAEKDELDWE